MEKDLQSTRNKQLQANNSSYSDTSSANQIFPEEDENKKLGKRLRELRQERGLTIREVSSRSGISVNAISMIENGKTSPSVNTLHEIAEVFKTPVSEFFNEKHLVKKVVHVQSSQYKILNGKKISLVRLSNNLVGNVLSCSLITLPHTGGSGKSEVAHSGYEFAYCLKGKLLYTIENEHYLLEPGDSIAFASELLHHWQNLHNSETEFLLVIVNALQTSSDTYLNKHLFKE